MKKITLIILILIPIFGTVQADVLRVNNQLPTNHQERIFQSLQEAHNFAQSGDTLMVEGSPIRYGNLNVSKRLVIIGTGFFLEENFENPGNILLSIVQDIYFDPGSEGSVLLGVSTTINSHLITINVGNIMIVRCNFNNFIAITNNRSLTGLVITQNYFNGRALSLGANVSLSNIIFSNNIVNGSFAPGSGTNINFASVNNNIFMGTGSLAAVNVRSENFRNNIIATNSSSITVNSNNVTNNLTAANQLTENGNQIFDPNQLFVGATGNSTDGQYQIKTDSPYLTAGFQGVEPGIFGGVSPYILSGLPPLPVILNLSVDSFGTQQNGLNVSIKAKTNN